MSIESIGTPVHDSDTPVSGVAEKAARGGIWNVTLGVASRAVGLAGTLYLTHVIVPADYGRVAVLTILVTSAMRFSHFGFGQFLIVQKDLAPGELRQIATLHNGSGLLALGLATAWLVSARPLHDPRMVLILAVLAVSAVVDRWSYVPERLLARKLRFRAGATLRGLGEISYTAAAVACARLGYGVTSLVVGIAARAFARLALAMMFVRTTDWLKPQWPRIHTIRRAVGFTAPLYVSSVALFITAQWDTLLVARLFGIAPSGLYNLAYNLASVPSDQIGEQLADVLLPSFVHVSPVRRGEVLAKSFWVIALVMFPIGVGLACVSASLTETFLDSQWQAVAPILAALVLVPATRPLGWAIGSLLQAEGRTLAVMWLDLGRLVLVFAALWALSPLGLVAASWGIGAAFALHAVAGMVVVAPGIPFGRLFRQLAGPVTGSFAILLGTFAVRRGLVNAPPAMVLMAQVFGGALAYGCVVFALNSRDLVEVAVLLKRAMRSGN